MKHFVLIQFRSDKTKIIEKEKLKNYFEKNNSSIKAINFLDDDVDFSSPEKLLKNINGVILGGSGQFYLSSQEKNLKKGLKKTAPFIRYLLKNDFPTLGICFGHQILGYFLKTKVINDKLQAETGSYSVFISKENKNEPIFSKIPKKFIAQFGHKDSLLESPFGCLLLAKTKKCKIAAFRYKEKIYGVQFHPELSAGDIKKRLKYYPEHKNNKIKILASPFSSRVLKNFIEIC